MKKILLVVVLSFLVSGCVVTPSKFEAVAKKDYFRSSLIAVKDGSHQEIILAETKMTVEIVNTPVSITQGLSGRTEIGSDGMLFIMPQGQTPIFWMKEMLFDLDIIWISDGVVTEVTGQVPAPDPATPLLDLPKYSPREPADLVLEMPSGKAQELGISPGDKVQLAE